MREGTTLLRLKRRVGGAVDNGSSPPPTSDGYSPPVSLEYNKPLYMRNFGCEKCKRGETHKHAGGKQSWLNPDTISLYITLSPARKRSSFPWRRGRWASIPAGQLCTTSSI